MFRAITPPGKDKELLFGMIKKLNDLAVNPNGITIVDHLQHLDCSNRQQSHARKDSLPLAQLPSRLHAKSRLPSQTH